VIAHDSRNLREGTGGPSDPSVLYTAADVAADLDGTGLDGTGLDGTELDGTELDGVVLVVEKAVEVLRPVDGADRPAIDALLRAVRAR
jgi:hypothetical protein